MLTESHLVNMRLDLHDLYFLTALVAMKGFGLKKLLRY